MVTVSIDSDGADRALSLLQECLGGGGVAIFPADGLYGLCCDPIDREAIERIHRIKGRDEGKSSAVLYFSALAMRELIAGLPPKIADAVGSLLPGPLTLILPNPDGRYPLACREDRERLGVRLLDGPLEGMPLPLFQTSANRSGEEPTGDFRQIDPSLLEQVDLAIDGGILTGEPSTVVDLTGLESEGGWEILREGAVSEAELRRRLGG